tara:strand:+ start:7190 stop:8593 length:1404 start_codon:yes stop_codon:yes gene_type:complete
MSQLIVRSAFEPSKILKVLERTSKKESFGKLSVAYNLFHNRDEWLPAPKRIEVLKKASIMIRERRELLALQAAEEGGKPLADSLVEIDRAVNGIEVAVQEIAQLKGQEIKMGITTSSADRMAFTRCYPRGVVLAISAFNHPFNLIVHQVIPAVAIGAPVLVKPASSTPLSCMSLVDILYEAGLPPEWCQVLLCEASIAQEIVSDSRISFLSFIGSAEVGFELKKLLPDGAHCVLEHGGVAPCILDTSADFKLAIPKIVKGSFYHAGQVCVSVQRLYVHRTQIDAFLKDFIPQVEKLKVGDPTQNDIEVGPLINSDEILRVDQWVKNAIESGAQLLCGGSPIGVTTYKPTVLLNPSDVALVSTDEVFGPVLAIYEYSDLEEAFARANNVPYCFQASMFTKDLEIALEATASLKAQTVLINDHTAFRVDWMPFGGSQKSGYGTGGIGPSMRDMSFEKMMVFHANKIGYQ